MRAPKPSEFLAVVSLLATSLPDPTPALDPDAAWSCVSDPEAVAGVPDAERLGPHRLVRSYPILLAGFDDLPGSVPPADVDSILFGDNPDGNLTEYFRWLSYGRAEVTGSVLTAPDGGWFTVGSTADFSDPRWDRARFAEAALAAADPFVDFASYAAPGEEDILGGGTVAVIAAGCGAAVDSRVFRPGFVGINYVTDDGAVFRKAMILPEHWTAELGSEECNVPIPLSVYCHEILHDYGLPDLKVGIRCGETRGSASMLGRWDIMDTGAWGAGHTVGHVQGRYDTAHPSNLNPWFKSRLGWLDLQEVRQTGEYPLRAYEDYPEAAIVWLRRPAFADDGEFFLIANWAATGFQRTLPSDGLMIWHFEPDRGLEGPPWPYALEQADGQCHLELNPSSLGTGDAGDPWPGSSGNLLFGPSDVRPDRPPWSDYNGACDAYRTPCQATEAWSEVEMEVVTETVEGEETVLGVRVQLGASQFFPIPWVPADGTVASGIRPLLVADFGPVPDDGDEYRYEVLVATSPDFERESLVDWGALQRLDPDGPLVWRATKALSPGTYHWKTWLYGVPGAPAYSSFRVSDVDQALFLGEENQRVCRKLLLSDMDGDGLGDLITLGPGSSARELVLSIAFSPGRDGGPADGRLAELPRAELRWTESQAAWNDESLAVGDLDGDGLDDLAIGLPDYGIPNPVGQGGVFVIKGRARTEAWPATLEDCDLVITQSTFGYVLGTRVLIEDADGGGSPDLLIGRRAWPTIPREPRGSLHIIRRAPDGVFPTGTLDVDRAGDHGQQLTSSSPLIADLFALGRFDGGAPELIYLETEATARLVAVPRPTESRNLDGRESLLFSASGGSRIAQILVADLQTDGRDDLLFSLDGEDGIMVFFGGLGDKRDTPPRSVPGDEDLLLILEPPLQEGDAGMALTTGDFNGDAMDDVAVGLAGAAPDGYPAQGRVLAYYGRPDPPSVVRLGNGDPPEGTFSQGGPHAGASLGRSLAVGDFDGDGFADLVSSAPTLLENRGGLLVLFGPLGEEIIPTFPASRIALASSPNPFLHQTLITMRLPRAMTLSLSVHDIRGRLVRRLLPPRTLRGERTFTWDGRDATGRDVPSGVYWVKLAGTESMRAVKVTRVGRSDGGTGP